MVRAPSSHSSSPSPQAPFTIPEILAGQSVLVTGGAGFVGSALLYRLVDPALSLRRIFTIIRGENPISRIPVDLHCHVAKVNVDGQLDDSPIVILAGDCLLPAFGLGVRERAWLNDVDIVIHTAGDTRFTLPLPKAVRAISDLAYAMCQFTIATLKVRTHIHLSTCFTGWFLPYGSVVREELVPSIDPNIRYEDHANTYLHAKSIAEGVVNAIGRPQAGRPTGHAAWRILRLSTIGPAASFPKPGWGAGHTSSPICGAIAAEVVDNSKYLPEAELDVVPVDVAVNQILALTAAAHYTGYPHSPLPHGSNVPIYHIAAGPVAEFAIPMSMLNNPLTKLAKPYIPAKNLLAAYRPMITKLVRFDTARTRHVLGLPPILAPSFDIAHQTKQKSAVTVVNAVDTAFGLTLGITDNPIDNFGFEVDVQKAVAGCGGWMRYLQLVRDKMEMQEEPESFESHVD